MREAFSEQLSTVRDELVEMAGRVRQAVADATIALIEADGALASSVIDSRRGHRFATSEDRRRQLQMMALQSPVATDLRMLVAGLRMVSDLERMGDLAVHVAKIVQLRLPQSAAPQQVLPIISRMGSLAEVMVGRVEHIIAANDLDAARALDEVDEEMDRLRRESFTALLSASGPMASSQRWNTALLGRYYERIADHAVSVANRVIYLVTGEMPNADGQVG
ncbi:MAG: phosphate signaling complex protein PhoU [Marmoricola sp.]